MGLEVLNQVPINVVRGNEQRLLSRLVSEKRGDVGMHQLLPCPDFSFQPLHGR